MSNQDQEQTKQEENKEQQSTIVSGSVEELAKSKDNSTLSSLKNKLYKQINEVQNTESIENSQLQATLNTLSRDMSKYADSKAEYERIAPLLEEKKKKTASKLEGLHKQVELCNAAINLRLQAGEKQIQDNITKMASAAANEGFKEFPRDQKTPDQHVKEEGEKGFKSNTGKEVTSPDLKKLEEQDNKNNNKKSG